MAWNTKGNLKGADGVDGADGADGAAGAAGTPGTNGTNGTNGVRGTKWFSGTANPTTVVGSLPGDWYLNTTTGDAFELV